MKAELKMPNSENIKEILNQVIVKEATVVMMTFRDSDTVPWLPTMLD